MLASLKEVDGGHDQANEHGEDEQDVKVLAPIQFLDDDAGDGENVVHNRKSEVGARVAGS